MSDDQHTPVRPRARIESLSDMIFGLALSVGAITLVSSPPTDSRGVISDLAGFGFSFLILIMIWLRYTKIMSALPLESQRVINLNIILLFLVSIEPFLFNILRSSPSSKDFTSFGNVASSLYAVDLGTMFLILGFFTFSLADEERQLVPLDMMREFRRQAIGWFVNAAVFFVTVLPFFFTVQVGPLGPIRYYVWFAVMFYGSAQRWMRLIRRNPSNATASS